MTMDFTPEKYSELLSAIGSHADGKCALRHDVDLRPDYALRIATIENSLGFVATYYFRTMHFNSHAQTIKDIAALGHRVGYHYESLDTCHGNIDAAYRDFCLNLERLRRLAPVTTACAHGSPRSPHNSQDIWLHHDIHALGIDYEPMIDTDFERTLYLTDTGRRWDGWRMSVRDKVAKRQRQWEKEGLSFHTTDDIIRALQNTAHPIHRYELLINTHPQRWMPFGSAWLAEAAMQQAKNIAKWCIVSINSRQP